jgi:acetolactate decarboxylase
MNQLCKYSFISLLLVGCNVGSSQCTPTDRHQITQVSIINALMLGQYDGVVPMQELLHYGNFGLGTCDHLDGELVVLDGKAFQAKSDGTVAEVNSQSKTPFAIVTPFDKAGEAPCTNSSNLDELEGRLDVLLPNHDLFFAIRVDADFESITFRSVPRQEPPYALLADVAKHQAIWTHQSLKGTLVGIRSPKWVHGLSVPGYHWHFLSSDHNFGGHVLDCKIRDGTIAYDQCSSWLIKLNDSNGSNGIDVSADLSHELDEIEHLRGTELRKAEP